MPYFFINTDAVSLGGISPHDKWFEYGYAFSGGPPLYGHKLSRMSAGDTCLMYASGIGIVGIGKVLEPWDGITYSDPLVYKEQFKCPEYRIKVKWQAPIRNNPIKCGVLKNRLGWNPSSIIQMLKREKDINAIGQLINEYFSFK